MREGTTNHWPRMLLNRFPVWQVVKSTRIVTLYAAEIFSARKKFFDLEAQ